MHYATRPGFRIAELQISQTQRIPWHYHSEVQDTFYVIDGTIRIFTREPEEEVCLTAGQTYAVRPGRPHLVTNAGDTSAVFLVLQGIGAHDFVLSPDGERRLLRQALKVGWASNRDHPMAPRLHCEPQPIGGGHSFPYQRYDFFGGIFPQRGGPRTCW
jgi:mannose-6-phosphate isomerase-like protein (cupin superfamily)